jgi:hypothetical protein
MKQINHRLFIAAIVMGGMFVGMVKGQEARSRWVSKMKTRQENRKQKPADKTGEVPLDDYEIASFHRS